LYDGVAIEFSGPRIESNTDDHALPQPAPSRLPDPTSSYTSVFSPELDLILACCRDDSSGFCSARIQQILQHHLDWERLLQLAQHHGLVPLLYRRLSTAVEISQSASLESLRQQDRLNAHQTLWLTLELLSIHRHLAARGLEALPYKGPVLAESLYGNVALRQFSDLDLLVRSHDLPRIKAALAELGYEPGLHLNRTAERAYLESGYEYTFDGARGRNLLEIQWRVLPRFYAVDFDMDEFFTNCSRTTVGGRELRTLSPSDLLLALCTHAAKHVWMRLSWIADISRLARSQAIDWGHVEREARGLGILRILTVSLRLCHDLLGYQPPDSLRADQETTLLVGQVCQIVAESNEFGTESFRYFHLMGRLRERRRDRARLFSRLALTPGVGEWSMVRLPAPLFPLYRLVRMFRLIGRLTSRG